jgi:hypothetical protein
MNLGDFLNTLAAKAGMQKDPGLVDLLSNSELANQHVSDDFANAMDTALMSLEGAKNNRDLLNHYKPIILKAADDKLAILAEEYGIASEMQAEQSTYKKIDLLKNKVAAKIAELEGKVGNGARSEETAKLVKQIETLQKQIIETQTAKETELAQLREANQKQQMDMLINFELNGKRYANQDLGDTNVTIARALVEKAMKADNAILVYEGGSLKLKQADNPQLDYVDSGFKPVAWSDYTNRVLAEKHLLEVSAPDDTKNKGDDWRSTFTPTPKTVTLRSGKQADTGNIDAAASASMADLE